MQEQIQVQDATVIINAGFGGTSIDVACPPFEKKGLTIQQFAELVYPAIKAASDALKPAPPVAPAPAVTEQPSPASELAPAPDEASTRRPIPPVI